MYRPGHHLLNMNVMINMHFVFANCHGTLPNTGSVGTKNLFLSDNLQLMVRLLYVRSQFAEKFLRPIGGGARLGMDNNSEP